MSSVAAIRVRQVRGGLKRVCRIPSGVVMPSRTSTSSVRPVTWYSTLSSSSRLRSEYRWVEPGSVSGFSAHSSSACSAVLCS